MVLMIQEVVENFKVYSLLMKIIVILILAVPIIEIMVKFYF